MDHGWKPITVSLVVGFLFLYHLHGRSMLDVTVHQLLLYAVFGQALIAFMEVFHRGNIILELLRCALTILQGSWFWQVHIYEQSLTWFMLLLIDPRLHLLFGHRLDLYCTLLMARNGT